jgi:hypothetical protein
MNQKTAGLRACGSMQKGNRITRTLREEARSRQASQQLCFLTFLRASFQDECGAERVYHW